MRTSCRPATKHMQNFSGISVWEHGNPGHGAPFPELSDHWRDQKSILVENPTKLADNFMRCVALDILAFSDEEKNTGPKMMANE